MGTYQPDRKRQRLIVSLQRLLSATPRSWLPRCIKLVLDCHLHPQNGDQRNERNRCT